MPTPPKPILNKLCVSSLLKLVLQEIEHRVSKQSENLRKQHNSYKSREEKYQLKDTAYEALRTGAAEEHELSVKSPQTHSDAGEQEWYAFIGRRAALGMLGSPYAINQLFLILLD